MLYHSLHIEIQVNFDTKTLGTSVTVLAEISPRSPRKLFIFIIKVYIYRIQVSKNY